MIKKLILTYQFNRKVGAILQPSIAIREEKSAFYNITPVLPETNQISIAGTNEDIQNMLKICFEYTEKHIFTVFGKVKQTQTEFYQEIEKKFLQQHIRPYIDKRLISVLRIAYAQSVPVYYKQSNNVFETDKLNITDEPLACRFHFDYQEKLRYSLSLQYKDQTLSLKDQKIFILCEEPSVFIMNQNIYFIEDFNTKKIIPFINKNIIEIPQKLVDEYFNTFVRKLIRLHNVTASGFEINRPIVRPHAQLDLEQSLNNNLTLNLSFSYEHIKVRPDQNNDQAIVEFHPNQKSFTKIERNSSWELEKIDMLQKLGLQKRSGTVYTLRDQVDDYMLIEWLNRNYEKLRSAGFRINSNLEKAYYLQNIDIELKIKEKNDWFDLYGIVKLGNFEIPFVKLRNHILKGNREFQLPDGTIAIIPEAWFSEYRDLFGLGKKEEDSLRFRKYQFDVLKRVQNIEKPDFKAQFKSLLSDERNFEIPVEINATLRTYQKAGYEWMRRLREFRFGGCLADDMGLGKTLQTLSLLAFHHFHGNGKANHKGTDQEDQQGQLDLFSDQLKTLERQATSLIIAPASIVHNWENEAQKFAPSLKIKQHTGNARTQNINNFRFYDLIITTYGVIRNDINQLEKYHFDYIVIDESQHIKNPDSVIYKAVSRLQAQNKLVLTGTPIENSLTDLWAQLNFINPGLTGSQKWFRDYYAVPIEKNQDQQKLEKLKKLTTPFVLRRTKNEVARDLPPLTEQTILCEMTEDQHQLYEEKKSATRNALMQVISHDGIGRNTTLILKALNELRQMANNPLLLDENYNGNSGKTEVVARHLENLVAEKHKVLIFSSYVKHLNLVETICQSREWPYKVLTGQTKNREDIIQDFQDNENIHLFLISLKAGGVGLNLTAADYVMMLDPWWNPAAEAQAINRAHRIGQDKNVIVYRYITKGTIEEKILILQSKKQKLSDELIDDNIALKNMTTEEIENLFK
ncbi:ATP-dependent helicase HepA [Salinivirga cyanobacteriivorans]|uniref:ATP-dependent helicase HepA n=1 Tax=Salinivirga cyanobacteriivorans TaxID=1307839 RepID=A0A0S2I463_9BACT|nr:DEAD/DEAH box helicase [Salinivirga cyanobacteriivorans]ALO17076.1 ATP-dependent helicase HepA [Salinivirga cyanobacteriivorans]